ncbi:uncharacterized protein I303_104526 [Kwoniella dejecticola CBS 10117]|uniref:Amine oxidase domain-containing protein n=1 Tax=Kwoniella dejecticola CBS 10117 TaxID=1296121 RepID=A0A1A6A522_9TREE|nr:uncharacterized protein I303_04497 [Kwoniella dejecticola CBS 10117]OBR85165.1 hypothetical protein I303_04497 [Kwoniella dejecticola CBS 10117]
MRIAIVGTGVSGISALWLLNEFSEHEVNIYEKDSRPGGHTNTVEFKREGKEPVQVDTGFIVCNPPTYPNFLRFLKHLKIPLLKTEMTFSVTRDRGAFEWAGEGLGGVFCQLSNLFNPRLYRMLFDVIRFNLFATDLLDQEGDKEGISIGTYLQREGYSDAFRDDYLMPMTGAIWSTPADQAALDFPASTLIRFFHNHHLLQITGKPKWLTVDGGSKKYLDAVLSKLPEENLHLNTEITAIESHENGVNLVEASGQKHLYDHVILATHSDTTLKLLRNGGGLTEDEEKALGPWKWSKNEAILHYDEKLMPIRRKAYSAWNYLTLSDAEGSKPQTRTTDSEIETVSLTYSMNILQHIPEDKHGLVLVTLNPPFPADESKVVGRYQYEHPMMTRESVAAQALLPAIQNKRGISFAGAWTKYGFHEDGFTSSLNLLVKPPFNVKPPFEPLPASRGLPPNTIGVSAARLVVSLLEAARRKIQPVWYWVRWVTVIFLVWLEQIMGVIRWTEGETEVRRLKGIWVGDEGQGKKRR